MKTLSCLFLSFFLCTPAFAGLIRHDTADDQYTGFANNPAFASVGLLLGYGAEGEYSCSGTIIHEKWVLTAGHCLTNASAMSFALPTNDGNDWRFYEPSSWVTHENFSMQGHLDGWDIGLVGFDGDFTTTPAQLYTGESELFSVIASVGFGVTGNGETGVTHADYKRRGGINMIDDTWSTQGTGDQILWADFDHPTDASFNSLDIPGYTFDDFALELEYLTASGDSGGGLFIEEEGQLYLAGVHSFSSSSPIDGSSKYGDVYGSTRVNRFIDWISGNTQSSIVPEPGGMILLTISILALGFGRRRANEHRHFNK